MGTKYIGQDNETLSVILLPLKSRQCRDEDVSQQTSPKKSNHGDMLIKCFSVIKKLFDSSGGGFGDSYFRHCVAMVELYKKVSGSTQNASNMTGYQSMQGQLFGNGLLNPNNMKRLLSNSSSKEVKVNVLMIVSEVACLNKVSPC
ncbi:putative non-specific serine/threonine protein kinase [Helianthus anomalus]